MLGLFFQIRGRILQRKETMWLWLNKMSCVLQEYLQEQWNHGIWHLLDFWLIHDMMHKAEGAIIQDNSSYMQVWKTLEDSTINQRYFEYARVM